MVPCTIVQMPQDFRWSPIADLPSDWSTLTDGELRALSEVWVEQRQELANTDALRTFETQLHRRWAIETGVIEGAYTLDRGVTETLIREGIDANLIRSNATNQDPNLVAAMIEDHLEVLEGLFEFVKGGRELTTGYIKELHAVLLKHVRTHTVRDAQGNLFEKELVKGEYKKLGNNPSRPDGSIHEYCPPEHVASEMDNLIRMHQEHQRDVPPEIEAAWLHHRFTQIHPFADGNGRVARAIASAVFIKADLFPLLVTRDDETYIPSLEAADRGNLLEVVRLFVARQRRAVIEAIESIPATQRGEKLRNPVDQQIQAAKEQFELQGKLKVHRAEWSAARANSTHLRAIAQERMAQVVSQLQTTLATKEWSFAPIHEGMQFARRDGKGVSITASVSREVRGFIIFEMWYTPLDKERRPLSDDFFQVNYKDGPTAVEERFRRWLDAGIAAGLERWRAEL